MRSTVAIAAIALFAALAPAQQGALIAETKHNLSVTGTGQFRAQSAAETCVFCHAPHKARTQVPLWNRDDSTATYLTYQSSTFQGTVAQPNGTTKLCLSCHDGTIALGRVVSLSTEITMLPGRQYLSSGSAFLDTNLRDDHPVTFSYAASRGGSGIGFLPAASITPPVHLDENGLVQCTSCHDPHNNTHGYFLHATDQQSAICLSCHNPVGWSAGSHANSTSTWNASGLDPWPWARYSNVRDNGCANCHRQHGAGHPERLLNFAAEEDNCLRCHNGNVASKNILQDLSKPYAHAPAATTGVHDPVENPLTMARHAECQDCHDPHRAVAGTASPPGVPGPLTGVSGIDGAGNVVSPINNGYELCYKCHADNHGATVYVPRQHAQANVRLEFDPNNPSFHPIESVGRNPDVPSLISPWTTSSRMTCTDCHDSNTSPSVGGTGARGPHGSTYRPILALNQTTTDYTTESQAAYALCYKCHSRTSILADQSFKEHKKHIQGEDAPCTVCHDPHGVSATQGTQANNAHLINFDTSVVSPSGGVLQFTDNGRFHGSCRLVCHGKNHNPKSY
ncbi:MAG: cytochrome c3 family protein [Planctomycetota bacterium]